MKTCVCVCERERDGTKLLCEVQRYAYFTLIGHTLTINERVQPFLYQALKNEVHIWEK